MKILSFLFGILFAENPECNENHKRICETRKGYKCVGKWNYWGKEKFECRKTVTFFWKLLFINFQCIDENCGNCSNSGTEYKYSGNVPRVTLSISANPGLVAKKA